MIPKGYYRHFKGNLYFVAGVGTHTETEEKMVVYWPADFKRLPHPEDFHIRPLTMFEENVAHEGRIVPRFTRLGLEDIGC